MTRHRGFALMLAIFLIVTLAAVGVYLVTVSTGQIEAATQDEQGARAYQAARAGMEWGAYQILQKSTGAFAVACTAAGNKQELTFQQGLSGFYADVRCQEVGSEAEGGAPMVVKRLQVTGCNASPTTPNVTDTCCPAGNACGPLYVERQLQLTLTQ
jgi:MSHA biogenesis protein MshP